MSNRTGMTGRFIVRVAGIFLVLASASCVLGGKPAVVPMPNSLKMTEGPHFELDSDTTVLVKDRVSLKTGEMLAAYLRPATGFELPVKIKPGRVTSLLRRSVDLRNSIILSLEDGLEELGDEGYQLKVDADAVLIRASTQAGLFYGVQTLRQLMPPEIFSDEVVAEAAWRIPSLEIEDAPRFGWRAFLFDEARHFKGPEVVRMLLDQMATLKKNVFHWYLTDDQGWRIEIKGYPRLTEVGSKRSDTQVGGWRSPQRAGEPHEGYYTQDEIREIVAYAAERHITIVPVISMPGHISAAVAAYPELGTTGEEIEVAVTWGKMLPTLNVADENVYRIMNEILDEVVELFPGDVVHIGGDEVRFDHWRASEDIKALMEREGLDTMADVQIYFTNRMSNDIAAKGRRTMGWNEILGHDLHGFLRDGQTVSAASLDTGTIIHFWKGDPHTAREAVERGHDVVNAWHVYTYLDYNYQRIPLEKAYAFEPIFEGLEPEYQEGVLGLSCQMWSEFIPKVSDLTRQVFPRIAAYAEVGWTEVEHRDYDGFLKRMAVHGTRWDIEEIGYHRPALPVVRVSHLAVGRPVEASLSLPGMDASLANNGLIVGDRYWGTDVLEDPEAWWQVDLEEPTRVGRVVLVCFYGDNRHYGFTVEGSLDGSSWEMLADRRDNTEPSTKDGYVCTFDPRPLRYLRVTMTSNSANTGRHLTEVMVFED